jgi:hypothetical protein
VVLVAVVVVVAPWQRVLLLFGLPCSAERHGLRMRLSCRVFRGRKSNNNRIHTARSNYMGSRRRTLRARIRRTWFVFVDDDGVIEGWRARPSPSWELGDVFESSIAYCLSVNTEVFICGPEGRKVEPIWMLT